MPVQKQVPEQPLSIGVCKLVLVTVNPIKLKTGFRPNSAGIPYTLLLRIEAMGFPTFWLLLYLGRSHQLSAAGRNDMNSQLLMSMHTCMRACIDRQSHR